jgi:plastocyanin
MKNSKQSNKSMNNEPTNQPSEMPSNDHTKSLWSDPPWTLLVAVLVIAVAAIAIALAHKPANKVVTTPSKQAKAQITISKAKFSPSVIDVKTGQVVIWTNQDSEPHWIASDPYPKNDTLKSLNSDGPLQTNESYTHTFDKTGTYTYHDQLHPYDIKGTVRVK